MKRDHLVKWAGGRQFIGSGSTGHSIVIDGEKLHGSSPMELMLLSAGSCACIDLVIILEKARQKVVDVWVEIGGDRREEMPHYYTDIELHFNQSGRKRPRILYTGLIQPIFQIGFPLKGEKWGRSHRAHNLESPPQR